ncbi:n-acetyltransferase domain-containing protein [Trichonephila clavata]|uniref:N-acetyltransferase domain-containing protein n=1 Tax=Trichonephila clavata TaxID=2740835 RepID=A0A8X6KTD3_TRICU|nr:n-acetyltransferase domain-containing protein [Trichonephila clavata]
MPRTLTTIIQEDKGQSLAEKGKFCFTIRNACEDDIPSIMETRKSIGIHDVSTVVQTAIKLCPQGIKIAETEDGKIIGTGAVTYIGDDENGIYFGGLYYVSPKFRSCGVGVKLFNCCYEISRVANLVGNSVPEMVGFTKTQENFP